VSLSCIARLASQTGVVVVVVVAVDSAAAPDDDREHKGEEMAATSSFISKSFAENVFLGAQPHTFFLFLLPTDELRTTEEENLWISARELSPARSFLSSFLLDAVYLEECAFKLIVPRKKSEIAQLNLSRPFRTARP